MGWRVLLCRPVRVPLTCQQFCEMLAEFLIVHDSSVSAEHLLASIERLRDCRRQASHGFCDWRRLCFHTGAFYHPSLAVPFRFLDELGHPTGVRVRSVEREPKIRKQPVFQIGVVISAQTCFHLSLITVLVSRIHTQSAPG